ncbi:uncharacterized protein C7orf31 [Colossoma macropomum]|uniref:uncharacterized protein C7orf31 n=1 Tax=Colossoma macropomum TaxID=42526 RepID=UPI0018645840|nr:uncharacterized protein C7orf31 [Colossoma macropomum]
MTSLIGAKRLGPEGPQPTGLPLELKPETLHLQLEHLESKSLPRSVTIAQYYDLTPNKRSDVRINDELIPKPTDINIGENLIKVSIQREHPYQSHISRCAMFPTYRCPDDPHTGVRAATKLPLNPLLPASAPQVTLLNKTKGAPYRHELLDVSMATQRNVTTWPGQNGFQNHTKPVKGEMQVFYPKAPKTLCPNMTLRDWKTTLSERTANMLRNLEKIQWLTSYQLHYTGTGPSNPIKLDDFNEKTIGFITGEMNPYTAQLRERSYPTFLPPRPLEGRKARILQNSLPLESRYPSPSPSFPTESPGWGLVSTQTPGALEASAEKISIQDNILGKQSIQHYASVKAEVFKPNEANESSQPRHTAEFNSAVYACEACGERNCACRFKLSEPGSTEPPPTIKKPAEAGNKTEKTKLEQFFTQNIFQPALQDKEHQAGQGDLSNSKVLKYMAGRNPFELSKFAPSIVDKRDGLVALEQPLKQSAEEKERVSGVSRASPCILPRSSSAPFRYGGRTSSRDVEDGLFRSQSALLELQDSFSHSEAHRRFHETLQGASMDLRDNRHSGRKHSFYGFNSYYFHN